ncbi:MAG: metallophosphatase family protein [Solirubrobacteraceae bacterium MAG38_C4-C5]|nr:metallophosphatase family protein [Candidatus Siliceabacter maunaloa]
MLALIYDVHGNLAALEAVLADARDQGATGYLIGGDVALFGPRPVETVARLRELQGATWIRGNGERWTDAPGDAPEGDPVRGAIAFARAGLGHHLVLELAALPESAVIDGGTRAWHGSPVSDVRSFLPQAGDDEAELLEGVTETRLVFGHTHLPFRRTTTQHGIELINPGSVGMPFDHDPRAAYALLGPGGEVQHRRVPYDHAAAVALLRTEHPQAAWAVTVAARIEQARVDAG